MSHPQFRSTLLFALAIALLTILFTPLSARSQGGGQVADSCESCYQGYVYRDAFTIGAYDNSWGFGPFLRDTLRIDWVRTYGGPFQIGPLVANGIAYPVEGPYALAMLLNDTSWIGDLPESREQWVARGEIQRWTSILANGLGTIHAFDAMRRLLFASTTNYVYRAHYDSLQCLYFADYNGMFPIADTLVGGYAWSAFIDSASADSDRYVAGRPVYTSLAIYPNSDARTYSRTDSLSLYADSADYFDFVLSMKVDSAVIAHVVDTSTIVSYAILFRRDTTGQDACHCAWYVPFDTVRVSVGRYGTIQTDRIDTASGYRDVVHTFQFPSGPGIWSVLNRNLFGNASGDSACIASCATSFDSLLNIGALPPGSRNLVYPVEQSDFIYSIFTTRDVPWSLAGARLENHVASQIVQGAFDHYLDSILTVFYQDTLNAILRHFEVTDEVDLDRFRAQMILGSRLQRMLLAHNPQETRGIWSNPKFGAGSYRLLVGDLDTTGIKMIPTVAPQYYNYGGNGVIPAMYANPDSMDTRALYTYFRGKNSLPAVVARDTISRLNPRDSTDTQWTTIDTLSASVGVGRICYNNASDYARFTRETSGRNLAQMQDGKWLHGLTAGRMALMRQAIDASRGRFHHKRIEENPVSFVVQMQGFLTQNDNGYTGEWTTASPPTPEMISIDVFSCLHFGFDGIAYGDFAFDGSGEFGIHHWVSGEHSQDYYDTMSSHDGFLQVVDPVTKRWLLPRMWYGFRSRSNMLAMIGSELRDRILPMYERLDRHTTLMEVDDTSRTIGYVPLVRWVGAVQANLDSTTTFTALLDTNGEPVMDTRLETHLTISQHLPKAGDTLFAKAAVLGVSNRRLWPIDTLSYGSRYVNWAPSGSQTTGFGAIDVRRPRVVLRNVTSVMADSCTVTRLGDTGWSATTAFGDTIDLHWLSPGWGAFYVITPIPRGVSSFGVAYNNAVRAINPSHDSVSTARVVVYERDSLCYLRSLSSDGVWSPEFMINIVVDSIPSVRAYDLRPAIATVRNGTSCLAVWERRTAPAA